MDSILQITTKSNEEECDHDILFLDRWYGVYPQIKKGICKKCKKVFVLTIEEGEEKYVEQIFE